MADEIRTLLPELHPPRGGWERLLALRDRTLRTEEGVVAFVSGAVLTVAAVLVVETRPRELSLPITADRLLEAPATGRVFSSLDEEESVAVTASSAADERVRVVWVKRAQRIP